MSTLDNIAVFPAPAQEEPQEEQRKRKEVSTATTPARPKRAKKRKHSRDHLYIRRGIFHFRLKLNGVWVARSTHTSDREEAKKARLRALHEAEEGQLPTDFANLSFKAAADKWSETRKSERDPVTRQPRLQLATWRVDKHRLKELKAFFGDKKLIHINAADVEGYQRTRLEKVTATTINRSNCYG